MQNQTIHCKVNACQYNKPGNMCSLDNITVDSTNTSNCNKCETLCQSFKG